MGDNVSGGDQRILAALNAALGRFIFTNRCRRHFVHDCGRCHMGIGVCNRPKPLKTVGQAPKHLFLPACSSVYVLSITFIAPKFGVGNVVFFVLLGQLVSVAAMIILPFLALCKIL